MPGRISIREGAYGGWETASRFIADAGIHYLEVEMRPSEELERIAATLRAQGLDIATLSGGVNLDSEESINGLERMIEVATNLGIGTLFVSAGGSELERGTHMARLGALGDRAAAAGVVISLETHPPFCRNAEEMLRTINEAGSPGVGINLDTANIYYYNQGLSSAEELERVIGHVASLHLKDTDGGYESPNFPVLGQGVVDFPRIRRALEGVDFSGPLTIELEGPVLAGLDVEGCHQVVLACMDYLRTVGLA